MSLVYVQNFSISLDGFGTGQGTSKEAPFGHAGERLHEWMFATRWWQQKPGQSGGSSGVDDAFVRQHDSGIGAEIMGAGKFGYPGWDENPQWKGWWGVNPPFHTPVFSESFWTTTLADGSVYLNWRSYDDLAVQAAALLQDLDARHPRRLVIDLRDNRGGDFNAGRAFIEQIRGRPWLNERGVLFVLIGRDTFSAAMTNAIDFKTTTNATLVGEPAGAAPNNWQEVRRFTLPNSGLRVGVSTLHYAFLPGEAELRPDLLVRPTPSDWGVNQDASLRLILSQP